MVSLPNILGPFADQRPASTMQAMSRAPSRAQFDMVVITVTLMFIAFNVAKAWGNRYAINHPSGTIGKAAGVSVTQ